MPGDDLLIKVGADVGGAETQLRSLGSSVNQLDTHVGNASAKTGGLGSMLGGLVNPATLAVGGIAALGAGLFDTIGKAGAFDEKMASIRATMNPTGAEMQKLNDLALQLGQANDVGSVSASDAANAIFELGKAGISAQDQMNGVAKATLQLAAAAGPEFGVANSAALAADSLNMFGLKANSAKDVVNTLVGASNASSIGLEDMKYGLSAAGAVAHTVGMDFNDTATALAVFGSAGLKGSDAGTSLKTMLMNLQPQSKSASAQMEALGLITKDGANQFFDASGHIKSLADISGLLKDKLGGLTEQQRTQALMTMFGSDAVRGASVLFTNGSEGVKKMADAMHQQGDAAKVAADMSNNFKGKMEALGGTIETAQIKIGQQLTPALGALADMANGLVGGAISMLPGAFDAVAQGAGVFASFVQANAVPIIAGLGTLVVTVVIPAFIAWATAAGAAALATITAMAPVLIPIAAVGAAVALLKLAWDNNFMGIRDMVIPIVHQIIDTLSKFWTEVQPQLVAAWNTIQQVVQTVMGVVGNLIQTGMTLITTAWNTNWGGIQTIVKGVWDVISNVVKIAWELVSGIIKVGLDLLSGNWGKAWTDIKSTLSGIWDGIKGVVKGALEAIVPIITNIIPTIVKTLSDLAGKFLSWVGDDVLPNLPKTLAGIWDGLTKWVAQTAKDLPGKVVEIGTGLIAGITEGVKNAWNGFVNYLSGLIKDNLPQFIKDWLHITSPSKVMIEIGQNMMLGLQIGIAQGFPGVVSTLQTGMMDVVNAITPSAFGHGGGIGGGSIGQGGGIFKPVTDGLALIGTTARNIALPGLNDMGGGVHALLDGPVGAFATTMDRTQASSLAGMFVANWDPNAANGFNKYHNTSLHDMGSGLTVFKEGAIAAWHQITQAVTQYTQAVNNAPAYPGQYSGGGGYSGGGSGGGRTQGRPQVIQVVLDRRVLAEAVATDERMSTQASRYAR